MLSNQILQGTIDGLKSITQREISVTEREGRVIASTEPEMLDRQLEDAASFVASQAESRIIQTKQYFKVFDNGIVEYVVVISGDDEESGRIGKIAAFQIQSLVTAYKERFDEDNFIKNLLLDNLLLVDIYNRAKKLKIENDAPRIVYVIETTVGRELSMIDVVRSLFPIKGKCFVTAVDEKNIVLIKELGDKGATDEIEGSALQIIDALRAEGLTDARISIGTVVADLKNVSNSYKEAKMALEVGEIFEKNQSIINYQKLGIGRLIYQLPVSLCKMFVGEVLHEISVDELDDEILATAAKFFENNLNVSETSRQLYIHRNTLVYRLDRLQKITGLDLRNFDDAIIFKITLMVSQYMNYRDGYTY